MMYIKQKLSEREQKAMADKRADSSSFRRAEDWERLAILEVRVNDHAEAIRGIEEAQKETAEALLKINTTLMRIFYIFLGAIGMIFIHELGWTEALKAFL